ncbi:hypothetical protein LEP1GSC103_1138 [Leptospira borgpetersenii serovar Javanica str. UI 09931]|uniref:Uncharacterized protein n=1 Tax=Leptospira borgpetersenii serovar Javanica str. UI 09931 TaxID=1049767 RepID=A0AAV3J8U6_LEPBO|nr:hypothetical protein LEP1GSC101_2028 [Leptospira borgpetersenii str. UI 09149]EMK12673.1 hypothetical protein LEP1GSC066_3683 [Leptospira sp. serovar Kenya str. Sh9]EMN57747.1 hypothetical protein LEP1GSC090_0670 [Leptospira borgpetersenii serovar Javanica str. MK146]EPG56608.1 hypothetical protein LEP1GSC103_1138 [Leptospira borgpetersenii serovar Javanica str. UI 09931]
MIKTGFLILSLVLNVFFILKGIYSRSTDTRKSERRTRDIKKGFGHRKIRSKR